jgi:hypothetical protein
MLMSRINQEIFRFSVFFRAYKFIKLGLSADALSVCKAFGFMFVSGVGNLFANQYAIFIACIFVLVQFFRECLLQCADQRSVRCITIVIMPVDIFSCIAADHIAGAVITGIGMLMRCEGIHKRPSCLYDRIGFLLLAGQG